MAEIILKNKIKLAGLKGVRVGSAGLYTENGLKMSKNSFEALKKLGYRPYGFKSRQLTVDMLDKCDMIITMTATHKQMLAGTKNVYTMDEATGLGEVADPYGQDLACYVRVSHQLEDACNVILSEILKVQGE